MPDSSSIPVRQGATTRYDLDTSLVTRDLLREMTARYNLLRAATQPLVTFYNGQPYQIRFNPTQIASVPMGLLNDLYYGYTYSGALHLDVIPAMLKPGWVQ